MLTVEMHARGCVGVDCTLHGPKRKKISHFYTLVNLYIGEHIGQKKTQRDFHYYIGLILKCNEIKEKMRHLRRHPSVFISYNTWGNFLDMVRCVPSSLAPSSRIPGGLLGPHYLGYRPANRFLPSGRKRKKKKKR
jgi:hypothetical protein